MSSQDRFDGILLNMAQQLGSVEEILDTFFGFLNRKTDFYTGSTDEKAAEAMITKYFRKHWKMGLKKREETTEKNRLADEERKRKADEQKKKDEEEFKKRQEGLAKEPQIEEVTEEEAEKIKAEKHAKKDKEKEDKGKDKEKKEKKDGEESDDEKGPVPTNGGGTTDKYTWTQTLTSLEVFVHIRPGMKAKQIICDIGNNKLKVGIKGEPLILDGEMGGKVKPDDCLWTLVDNKMIQISMEKFEGENWWSCVMKGDAEINCKKIVPENSKLSDLDGESRTMVEKMMYDQKQKHLGKPTSDQEKQHNLLEKFKAAHPEMDFSKTKINYGGGAPGSSMSLG